MGNLRDVTHPPSADPALSCVILQPSYIPWRGYFHQIHKADVFVFLDDVPYDSRGWRNRNRIKTPGGERWLTIPTLHKGSQADLTPIRDIRIAWDRPWNRSHWETIRHAYGKAPHFRRYADLVESFYLDRPESLASYTIATTIALSSELGITGTRFLRSSDLPTSGAKTDRLVSILAHLGATHYITGPSARGYLEEDKLAERGIGLEYMTYDYPPYPQLHGIFSANVSILDLLFMMGEDALSHIAPN